MRLPARVRALPVSVIAPRTEHELLARARDLAGRTVGELARALSVRVPGETRRAKGLVGALVERALGADAGTKSAPDFGALGIELKTIPLRVDGTPRESTFVCTIPLERIAEMEWDESPVRAKLARVLFVPVESDPSLSLDRRRLGAPFVWSPSDAQDAALRADWDDLAGLIGAGLVDRIDARLGRCLQVRPKGKNARDVRRAADADGSPRLAAPRGFYLRARFTATIVRAQSLAPG